MLTLCAAAELQKDEILFSLLHPGWVRTDMGGEDVSQQLKTKNDLQNLEVKYTYHQTPGVSDGMGLHRSSLLSVVKLHSCFNFILFTW